MVAVMIALATVLADLAPANDNAAMPLYSRFAMCGDLGCEWCQDRELHPWELHLFTPDTAAIELRLRFPRAAR